MLRAVDYCAVQQLEADNSVGDWFGVVETHVVVFSQGYTNSNNLGTVG